MKSMRLNLHIAWRFLLAKRRAMIMSLVGIIFGVAFFILTQAQTRGFEQFFVRTILGINGAIRVQDKFQYTVTSLMAKADDDSSFQVPLREGRMIKPGIEYPDEVKKAVLEFNEVEAVAAVIRGNASIQSGFKSEDGRVIGVNVNEYLSVSDLGNQILYGDLKDFRNDPSGLLIGWRLAERLQARLGDTVLVRTVTDTRRMRIRGIFETGVDQYDKYHFYVHMSQARILLNKPHGATYLQVSISNPDKAQALAKHMEHALGHYVASWQEREKSWLQVFNVMKLSSAITMSTIILIAGLGMFNTLAIIVMERSREIAILRSMGFTRKDIARIFINQGLIVLVGGIVGGCALAAFLTYVVERLPIRIRGIFSTDHFIVTWSIWHYVSAIVVATVVVLFASYLPARRATKVEPGDVVRGTGG